MPELKESKSSPTTSRRMASAGIRNVDATSRERNDGSVNSYMMSTKTDQDRDESYLYQDIGYRNESHGVTDTGNGYDIHEARKRYVSSVYTPTAGNKITNGYETESTQSSSRRSSDAQIIHKEKSTTGEDMSVPYTVGLEENASIGVHSSLKTGKHSKGDSNITKTQAIKVWDNEVQPLLNLLDSVVSSEEELLEICDKLWDILKSNDLLGRTAGLAGSKRRSLLLRCVFKLLSYKQAGVLMKLARIILSVSMSELYTTYVSTYIALCILLNSCSVQ